MTTRRTAVFFAIPVLVAAFLRFSDLPQRPMHADEAVNADKFGILLEQGRYEYSTVDFHGPTLHYLTLLPAWLLGITRYPDLSEATLRSLPALFGVLIVALHFFLVRHLGFRAAFCAAFLTALSPAMVYYSRYFIHETLFVFFVFCALISVLEYSRNPKTSWAAITGLWFGLMYATKETAVLAAACLGLAFGSTLYFLRRQGDCWIQSPVATQVRHLLAAGATAILCLAVLMSFFLNHPRGILDSVTALETYFLRGMGHDTFHVHPWYFYLHLLLYFHSKGNPIWTECSILALAAVGIIAVYRLNWVAGPFKRAAHFLAVYTLALTLIYALIPYKAPWNVLGFLHGMILLAGLGAVRLIDMCKGWTARLVVLGILTAAGGHLGWQARAGSLQFGADPCNPWVYAHTSEDIYLINGQLEDLARVHPSGHAMPVQIISRENLWPLPWYLRRYSGVRWWNGVPNTASNAPVIIITPDMEPDLIRKLYDLPPPGQREMYMNIFDRYVELRPQVELRGYAAKWLWDELQRQKAHR